MEGELRVAVAMLRAAHAGDARGARQVAGFGDEAPRVASGDLEARAGDGARRAGVDAGGVASGATVAGRRRGWQRAIEHDEGPVGPPGSEARMNLEPQRPRSPQPRGAPDALKGNERPGVEREPDGVPDGQRRERRVRRVGDDAGRVAIERVGRAVRRLRCPNRRDRRKPGRPIRRSTRRLPRAAAHRGSAAPPRRRTPRAAAAAGRSARARRAAAPAPRAVRQTQPRPT